MKKKLSFLIALICAIVCVFSLAACGGSSAKPTDVTGKKYVFSDYKIEYSSNFPDEMKYPQGVLEEIKEHYKDTYVHFFTDGTVEMSAGQAARGTYTQTDKDVVITLGGRTLKGTATGDKFELKNLVTLPGSEYQASEIYIYKLDEESSLPPDQGEAIDPVVSQQGWTAAFERVTQSLSSMKWTAIFSDSSKKETFCHDPARGASLTVEFPADGETVDSNEYKLMTKSEGKYYAYYSEDGKSWTRREVTEEEYQTAINQFYDPDATVALICSGLAQCYSSFTLTDGVYTASDISVGQFGEAQHSSVTFADGALIEIDIAFREGFTFSLKFGMAEFEIPTDFIEDTAGDPEVSQEAWTAAFEQVEQSLSSMKWTLISSDSSMTGTICYDPAKGMSITEEYPADGETVNRNSYELMEKSDGKYYVYSSEDGKSWTRREVTEEDYQTSVNMVCNPNSAVMLICSGLAQCYSSFTLTDGVYSASNVTVSPVGEAQHVSVTFADGALIEIDITVREGFTISLKFGVAEFEIPTNFTESTMVN